MAKWLTVLCRPVVTVEDLSETLPKDINGIFFSDLDSTFGILTHFQVLLRLLHVVNSVTVSRYQLTVVGLC